MPETIVNVNNARQYNEDYTLYALYVCRERVAADLRDGLKPVARKILLVQYEFKGKTKYPNTTKSAKIVGAVMGDYHPHGDCICGLSPLYGLNGEITTIENLYLNNIQKYWTLGVDPKSGKVIPVMAHSFRIGQYAEEIYHINFSNGYTLSCTGNHPIMDLEGVWHAAKDISAPFIPYRRDMRIFSGRPSIDGELIQNIVYDNLHGSLPDGYVRHHNDENIFNNSPENLIAKSKEEHAKDHADYFGGLSNGRKYMFDYNGPIHEMNKEKNSRLISAYNEEQGIRRFKVAIRVLLERNILVSEENYETLRGEIYNLPIISRLIAKGYGTSFNDLVDLELRSIGEIYADNPVEPVVFRDPLISYDKLMKNKSCVPALTIKAFDKLISEYGYIDYELYIAKTGGILDEREFAIYLDIYLNNNPFVTSIELEKLESPAAMYDFTVDGYENILLPMVVNQYGSLPFFCIHNSGIYGAMKPMTNDFEIYVPLLNGQGGWGDKFGGEPAKMRYTESGLSQFAQEYLLKDLYDSPNCVDWIPTFDDSSTEPECLPAAVPMVLIEGTFGIAVGFKVEIPKHNITEVLDATIRLLKNRDASVVLIPDHCQGCDIVNTDFETISNLGIGNYTVRGVIDTGVYNNKPALFLRSAPDLIYFQSIKEKILKLITAKKIINIVAMDDIKGQLVVTLKPGTDTNYIKQLIYQYTDMERSCRINFEVLDNKVPLRMSYKSYLLQWIEFRKFTKFRVYCNKLQTINTRIHNIEPYVKMTKSNDLDTVINLIKSKTLPEDELMEFLIKKFDLTDLQARFILNIKLKELSAHSFNQYIVEYDKLTIQRDNLMFLLTHDNSVEEEIVTELEEAKRKYGCKRHCRVISKGEAGGIPSGSFNLIITQNNFIKKIPVNEPMPVFRNDTAKFIIRGDNAENILIFSESGKVFKLAIHKIPFSDKRSNGIDIRLLLKNCSANINAIMYEPTLKEFIKKLHKYYLVALTRNGYIKKMDLDDFISANNSGLIYSKLDDGDYVKDVMIIHNTSDVVVYSTNTAIRISMEAIPYLKRATRGNRTMSSTVDGLSIVKNDTTDIIVVTKKGYVNRFSPVALLATDRVSKPSKVIKLTKDDEIVAVFGLQSIDTIVVNTTSGRLDIPVVNISVGSSVGGGTRMVQNRGDVVMSCSFIHNNQ